jgi:hypothetical protein
LNRNQRHGHIVGGQGNDALGIVGSAGRVSELQGSFDQSAVDSDALGRFRIFLQEGFEIADQGGAIVAGTVDGLLEFFVA